MSYLMDKANDIEYFIEGISAVCNDKSLITKKVKERFDSEYSKLIDYLLLLENEKFNAKALAAALNNRELEDGVRARRFQPHLSPAEIAKNKFN